MREDENFVMDAVSKMFSGGKWGLWRRSSRCLCRARKFNHPIWLALRNGYPLADVETYRRAMSMCSINHAFEKILLISRDGFVDELFGQSPAAT